MIRPFFSLVFRSLPEPLATRLVVRLSNRAVRRSAPPYERAALARGQRFAYDRSGKLIAWSWGSGAPVLLVHGWGGSAAQLTGLAELLANGGYQAIVLDITGHGQSGGKSPSWSSFVRDLATMAQAVNRPFHAVVGHSAGGLVMMLARWHGLLRADRYVCIAAPSHPYPPVRGVQNRFAPPTKVVDRFREYLGSQLGLSWSALESGECFRRVTTPLLLVYDEDDKYVDHREGDHIAALSPQAKLIKTQGNGHVKVLAAPETGSAVVQFLGTEQPVALPCDEMLHR